MPKFLATRLIGPIESQNTIHGPDYPCLVVGRKEYRWESFYIWVHLISYRDKPVGRKMRNPKILKKYERKRRILVDICTAIPSESVNKNCCLSLSIVWSLIWVYLSSFPSALKKKKGPSHHYLYQNTLEPIICELHDHETE